MVKRYKEYFLGKLRGSSQGNSNKDNSQNNENSFGPGSNNTKNNPNPSQNNSGPNPNNNQNQNNSGPNPNNNQNQTPNNSGPNPNQDLNNNTGKNTNPNPSNKGNPQNPNQNPNNKNPNQNRGKTPPNTNPQPQMKPAKKKKKRSPLKTFLWILLLIFIILFFVGLFAGVPTYYVTSFSSLIEDAEDGNLEQTFGSDYGNTDISEIWVGSEYYSNGGGMQVGITFEFTDGDDVRVVQYFADGEINTEPWCDGATWCITIETVNGAVDYFDGEDGDGGYYSHDTFVSELNEYFNAVINTHYGLPPNVDNDNFHPAAFVPPPEPGWFWTLIITWGPWLFFFVLAWIIIKKMMDKQQGEMSIAKSKAQLQISNVKFRDVAGYTELKTELREMVDYLKMPEKFIEMGAKTPKGVLMEGPPGTGKTLFAKAVAGEAGVPFFSVSGSDFVEMFIGVGAARIRNMFKEAKTAGKCLIFIDEIDAVGRARGAGVGGGNDEREQTLNQLLVEMDGFNSNSSIIVMAATNRADVLDPALIRPGRFDRKVTLRLPDVKERESILRVHLGHKQLSKKVDLGEIAKRTPGFSGAQLENVLNEAAILAVREGQTVITTDLIDEAIDRIIGGGPAKTSKVVSKEEKKVIAYHEAGHAIIGLKLKHAQLVQKITIIPRGDAGGYVLMTPKKEKMIQTKAELIASITSYLGGRASEELFFGADNVSSGASADIHSATEISRMMVTQLGMSKLGPIQFGEEKGSPFLGKELSMGNKHSSKFQYEIDLEIKRIIDESLQLAIKTIKKHKKLLIKIAEHLIESETITAEEIRYIEKYNKIPPKDFFSATKKEKEEAKKKQASREINKTLQANPTGTNPTGTNPTGTNPTGTNPTGTNPKNTNLASTNTANKTSNNNKQTPKPKDSDSTSKSTNNAKEPKKEVSASSKGDDQKNKPVNKNQKDSKSKTPTNKTNKK